MDPAIAINALITQVAQTRATVRELEAHLMRPTLGPDERDALGRTLDGARIDDAHTRLRLASVGRVRLLPTGRWEERWPRDESPAPTRHKARVAYLRRCGHEVEVRPLCGNWIGLYYEALAPEPLVTETARARGRAAAEVRGS
jgi:hypothetical protein